MGFWDAIYTVGDGIKGITPDLSTIKRAGGATVAAVTKIDQAIRVDGIQKLPQYLPDSESRAQIGLFTTTLAKNAAKYAVYEGFKHVPGATVTMKLVSDSMREVKQKNRKDGLKAKVDRLEEDLRKSTPQPEKLGQNKKLSFQNAGGGGAEPEKVEDVMSMFMKTEFIGNQMFRDLFVPKIARMEKKNE